MIFTFLKRDNSKHIHYSLNKYMLNACHLLMYKFTSLTPLKEKVPLYMY